VNQRLFRDYVRRHRRTILGATVAMAFFWFGGARGLATPGLLIAASLSVAVATGGVHAFVALAPREIRMLPISAREIWVTRWWLSTVVAVGAGMTGKVVGWLVARTLAGPTAIPETTIWLSSLCDFAYAGLVLGLLAVPSARRGDAAWKKWPFVLAMIAFAGSVLWPFALIAVLPVQWNQVVGFKAAVLAAALGATAYAYTFSPTVSAPGPHEARGSRRTRARSWMPTFSNVTGTRRLVLKAWLISLPLQVVLPLFVVGTYGLVDTFVEGHWQGAAYYLRDLGLLPFEPDAEPLRFIGIFIFVMVTSAAPWYLGQTREPEQAMLRHLRTLPMSGSGLTLVLVLFPLASWLSAWLVLAVFHLAVTGLPPASLRLPEFAAAFGVSTLVRAVTLRRRRPQWQWIMAGVLVGATAFASRPAQAMLTPIAVAVGAASMAIAVWLTHDTLTRRRDAYAPVGPSELPGAAELGR